MWRFHSHILWLLVVLNQISIQYSFSTRSLGGIRVPKESKFRGVYTDLLTLLESKEPGLQRIDIPSKYGGKEDGIVGKLGPSAKQTDIKFVTESYASEHLEYARMVSFCGGGYDVFNLLVMPKVEYNLPIFGADVVCLPGGALAAIDFQPAREGSNEYFRSYIYDSYASKIGNFKKELPAGGDFPSAAERYFSPHALWTRIPSLVEGGAAMTLVRDSIVCSFSSYLNLLDVNNNDENRVEFRPQVDFLRDYLRYRVENDPAKRLLTSAFGERWTELVLRSVLFPDPYEHKASK